MIQVLIVDDEPLVRSYIRSLIDWERYGFIVCGEACDGNDALEKIDSLNPNIVILDVYMPGVDGIALSGLIHEKYKKIKMIILSSYDKFDYVRETLKNGAVDYLLKHRIEASTLLGILEKTKQLITEDMNKVSKEKLLEGELLAVNSALMESYLKMIITESDQINEQAYNYFKNIKVQSENINMVLFVIAIKSFDNTAGKYSDKHRKELVSKINGIFRQIIGDVTKGCSAYLGSGRFSAILIHGIDKSENSFIERIQEVKRRIESSLRMLFNFEVMIRSSEVFYSIDDIPNSYKNACSEMELDLTLNDSRYTDERNYSRNSNKDKTYSRYVKEAIGFINEHYKENISLEKVARSIGVSAAYLSRLFSEETGHTLTEYLNKTRIDISKRMLEEKDVRVNEVYEAVGFKNYSYFFKVFKEYSGTTPLEYANKDKYCESKKNSVNYKNR
jgi:YesN/AraC family two-component response regulator